jgi:hypothetical protein
MCNLRIFASPSAIVKARVLRHHLPFVATTKYIPGATCLNENRPLESLILETKGAPFSAPLRDTEAERIGRSNRPVTIPTIDAPFELADRPIDANAPKRSTITTKIFNLFPLLTFRAVDEATKRNSPASPDGSPLPHSVQVA